MNETPEITPNNSPSPADRIKQWRWKKRAPSPNPGRKANEAPHHGGIRALGQPQAAGAAEAHPGPGATYADAAALGLLRCSMKGNTVALREMR